MRLFRTAFIAAGLAGAAHAGLLTNPPGSVTTAALVGYNGQTLSWGISLQNNDPNNWWVITGVSSDYGPSGQPDDIFGGFTDLLTPYFFTNFFVNNTALAPNQDLNLASPGSPVDLASFTISPNAAPGTIFGQLHISYDAWDMNPFDPNNPPPLNDQPVSGQFDIDTSVTSLGAAPTTPASRPTPEPVTDWLVAGGLAVLVTRLRSRRAPRF